MSTGIELARSFAPTYDTSTRDGKGTILDALTAATGWTRDHARHQLHGQLHLIGRGIALEAATDRRRLKPKKFSGHARAILQQVWVSAGRPCGKNLEAAMAVCLDSLERHGHLVSGDDGYSAAVRRELLDISAATIDRYLREAKGSGLRGSRLTGTGTEIRAALPRASMRTLMESEPGYFIVEFTEQAVGDGEPCRTVTFTDVETSWVRTETFAPGTSALTMLTRSVEAIPFVVTGALLAPQVPRAEVEVWARAQRIEVHRLSDLHQGSRMPEWRFAEAAGAPPPSGGRAAAAVAAANALWTALGDRLNFFTPVRNPIGWRRTEAGARRRIHDDPATPVSRLLASQILSPHQVRELRQCGRDLDLAALTASIDDLRSILA